MTTAAKNCSNEVWLTPAPAAAQLGVKTRALAKWADAGKLTVTRTLGGRRRYLEAEVQALAAQLRRPANNGPAVSATASQSANTTAVVAS